MSGPVEFYVDGEKMAAKRRLVKGQEN